MISRTAIDITRDLEGFAPAIPESVRGGRYLQLDQEELITKFNRTPFIFRHNLAGSHLFELPRLIELAKSLPESYVEYNIGNVPVSIDARAIPPTGLSIEDTLRRMEERCSWMVLKRVERDPEYDELLRGCLDQIQPISDRLEPGMYERAGSVFISSPNSVTPYHMDHEINFLLQISGTKTIYTFNGRDKSVLPEQELEDYFLGSTHYRNMAFNDEFQSKATEFKLSPGYLIHIPTTEPHWVKNGNAVSVSFSAAFQTRKSDQARSVHSFNAQLRRMGIRPRPYGVHPFEDTVKCHAFRALRRIRKAFTGREYGQTVD